MFAKYMLASLVIIASSLTADAGCSDTVSFTVLGQPNIAVGFYDTNANFVEPTLLGTVTKKTDQSQVSNAELVCQNDELKIRFSPRAAPVCPAGQVPCGPDSTKTCIAADWACDGVDDCGDGSDEAPSRCAPGGAAATATSATPWLTVPVGDGWTFDARATEGELAGYTWQTQAHLVDISYDTKFDGIDVLQGQFTVRAGNSYLMNLFGWIKGESTMERTVYPRNMQLKAATGTCPILAKSKADGGSDARTHYRIKDDFVDYGGLAQHTDFAKRMSFMKEYFAEQMDATILPDVQAEMGSKKAEFNNFYPIADGFRADEFSDIAMLEGSVIDPETPGTENAYGYDAIRFKMQCMTPFFLDFDPVEYTTFHQTESFRRYGKHEDAVYHTKNDMSNFGRKGLELQWIMHQTLNSVWEDDQFVDPSNVAVGGAQYPKPTIPLRPEHATFTMQGVATLAFSQFFQWWTGRAPSDHLLNSFKPYWISHLNFGELRARYGREDTNVYFTEEVRKDFLNSVVDSPIYQHLNNYTQQTGWRSRDGHDDILTSLISREMPSLISFIAKTAYDITNKLRADPSYRTMYKSSKVKFIHEWVRLNGGTNKIKAYDQSPERQNQGLPPYPAATNDASNPRELSVTYYKRVDYCKEYRYANQSEIPCLAKNIPEGRGLESAEFPGSIPEDFPDSNKLTTVELTHTGRMMDYVDLYSANRDPAKFEGPNTFNPNRKDWMNSVAWVSPLWAYYKSASADDSEPEVLAVDENGEYILDMNKAKRLMKRWSPTYHHSRVIIEDLVDLHLQKIESETSAAPAAKQPTCVNRHYEVLERFGKIDRNQKPTSDLCTWAMARIDVRLGRGVGCAKHGGVGGICCSTCSKAGLTDSQDYTNVMRMVGLRNMREEVFTTLTPAEWNYFLLTQKYYDDASALKVTIVGVDHPYVGAKNILEYYTLQVKDFNPDSHRHFGVRYENNTDVFVPVKGNQMQLLNMNPQVNNGELQEDTGSLWSDFAHFIWDDDHTVLPVRRAYVDFRYPNVFPVDYLYTISPQRVGAALPLLNSFGNTWDLCQLIHKRCYNKNKQFESVDECMNFMKKLPDHKLGYCPIFAGNTKSCRFMHSILAQDVLDPDFHCFHLGPNNPDPNGNVKCSDAQCGKEMQGPLECDDQGCEGQWAHSGTVVEWMFTMFHVFCVIWCIAVYWTLNGYSKNENLSQIRLQRIAQAMAVVTTLFWVFVIMSLIHIIYQFAQPKFFWRPPPLESLEMRYNEIGDVRNRFREYNYVGDTDTYAGQYTEQVFGRSNMYIANTMVYILMFMAFEMCCLIIEWAGYEMYYLSASASGLKALIPQVGHIVFVVFVSVAYTMPPSAFSCFIFLLGITQVGHPEMMLQSFNAAGLVHSELNEESQEEAKKEKAALKIAAVWRTKAQVEKPKAQARYVHEMKWSKMTRKQVIETVLQRVSAVGVCLHHMSMICVFLGYSLHILYTPQRLLFTGVRIIVFLVLIQHLVVQLMGTGPVGMILLAIVEFFFQHFTISYMGEAGSLLLSTSCLKLLLSHWLMLPIMVWGGIAPLIFKGDAVGAQLAFRGASFIDLGSESRRNNMRSCDPPNCPPTCPPECTDTSVLGFHADSSFLGRVRDLSRRKAPTEADADETAGQKSSESEI